MKQKFKQTQKVLPNSFTLLLPYSMPWGFMLSKTLDENAKVCSSITACLIRHRIVSFKQQVRPILLKMNPAKPIFWGSFYRILTIYWMYHSTAVEELCTVIKALPQSYRDIKSREKKDNKARLKKITAQGFKNPYPWQAFFDRLVFQVFVP